MIFVRIGPKIVTKTVHFKFILTDWTQNEKDEKTRKIPGMGCQADEGFLKIFNLFRHLICFKFVSFLWILLIFLEIENNYVAS